MCNLGDIATFIKSNQLMIGLIFSALIGTMPEFLPKWGSIMQWGWTWIRNASTTFLNFRRGTVIPPTEIPPTPVPIEKEKPQLLNENK